MTGMRGEEGEGFLAARTAPAQAGAQAGEMGSRGPRVRFKLHLKAPRAAGAGGRDAAFGVKPSRRKACVHG